MKLISVETNKVLTDIPNSMLVDLVAESYRNVQAFTSLEKVLGELKDSGASVDIEDLEQDALDEISVAVTDISVEFLRLYKDGECGPTVALQRRAEEAVLNVDNVKGILDKIATRYVAPSSKEAEQLYTLVRECLNELGTFLFFAFSVDATERSIKNNEELVITTAVKQFIDDTQIKVLDFVMYLSEVFRTHRPKLNIFETIPDMADEFYSMVGSLVQDFESVQEYVTTDLVIRVIKEEVDPEDALREILAKAAEANG